VRRRFRSRPSSMQNPRHDLDAVVVPDLYDRGVHDLAKVIGEHFQLPLDQRFHVLDDVGEIAWSGSRMSPTLSVRRAGQ
jgi:hypothetical protein